MKELKIKFDEVTSPEVIHEYAKAGKNYVQVEVTLEDGQKILDPSCRVYIGMSRDAMIALALNLLNEAYNPNLSRSTQRMWEWFPAYRNGVLHELGVAMHPKSCELKIFENNECESIFKLVGEKE